jgi:hypothetical protein
MSPGVIILIVVGVIGVALLLWASRDIEQLNTNSTNSTPESKRIRKKFVITIRSIAGLWFIIVAFLGLCRLLTGI